MGWWVLLVTLTPEAWPWGRLEPDSHSVTHNHIQFIVTDCDTHSVTEPLTLSGWVTACLCLTMTHSHSSLSHCHSPSLSHFEFDITLTESVMLRLVTISITPITDHSLSHYSVTRTLTLHSLSRLWVAHSDTVTHSQPHCDCIVCTD